MTSVLDAYALIAYLRGEKGGSTVLRALENGGAGMSWINLGEVLYTEARRRGEGRARTAIREVTAWLEVEEPDADLVIEAARRKVGGGISYPDCFALATAARHEAPLLTGDPEIIAQAGAIEIVDLR